MAILDFDKVCPQCEAENVDILNYADDVEHKGFILSVEGLQEHICNSCGHDWKTQEDYAHNFEILKAAYAVVRDKKRVEQGLLTAKEIENIRRRFGFSQREASTLFGGGYNAFNKYESGEVLQSFAMDRLLRMTMAFGWEAIEFLSNPYADHKFVINKYVIANFDGVKTASFTTTNTESSNKVLGDFNTPIRRVNYNNNQAELR